MNQALRRRWSQSRHRRNAPAEGFTLNFEFASFVIEVVGVALPLLAIVTVALSAVPRDRRPGYEQLRADEPPGPADDPLRLRAARVELAYGTFMHCTDVTLDFRMAVCAPRKVY